MALRAPRLGNAPEQYERRFFDTIIAELTAYFTRANAPYPHNASTLNINRDTLLTDADMATMRDGDVFRDSTALNVLKSWPATLGGGGGGTPGGSDTQVQFNDGGAFGGDDGLTWDKTNNILTVGTVAASGYIGSPSAASANTNGVDLRIFTGSGDGSGVGGTLSLTAGGGGDTGNGGYTAIVGGDGGSTSGNGGAAFTQGGNAGGSGHGGNAYLSAGSGVGGAGKHGGHCMLQPGSIDTGGDIGQIMCGLGSALATTSNGGFFCMPTCAGTPTGTPSNVQTGSIAMVYDTTNNKLYMYNGAWKSVTLA